MNQENIREIISKQRSHFNTNITRSYEYRVSLLKRLRNAIIEHESEIHAALKADLGKSDYEAYLGETGFVVLEIDHTLKKLKKWMKPKRVKTPLVHFPCKGYLVPEPLGTVLIISPWNYPFQLLISPLVGAIAAGNTAVLKPSEVAAETSKIITKIIGKVFDPKDVAVVEGAVQETTWLLEERFDHIFYTGNGMVAKIIMEKASVHLTPVTLELGGKSPCFIFGDVDIDLAAKRVVWGKFFNAGQTCVAPDYILIQKDLKTSFVEKLKKYIHEFYGNNPKDSQDYGRIINSRHFERLSNLIDKEKVLIGGDSDSDKRFISPTIMDASSEDPIMKDEIFGPILPIIEKDHLSLAIEYVRSNDKPLAAYAFSKDPLVQNQIVDQISAGGMCLNDTIIHLSVDTLPFGGVGPSGMGRYHGHYSFETFSHQKSVLVRSFWLDLSLRYPPYLGKLAIVRKFLHFIS